jgi:hypothetical protein
LAGAGCEQTNKQNNKQAAQDSGMVYFSHQLIIQKMGWEAPEAALPIRISPLFFPIGFQKQVNSKLCATP